MAKKEDSSKDESLVAGVGFAIIFKVQVCFGLFAIRRADTTNDAMFDPDVCDAFARCLSVVALLSGRAKEKIDVIYRHKLGSKGRRSQGSNHSATSRSERKKQPQKDCFFSLVAGVGFEPHDLRVMSPTSCQTAPSRDIMVPEAGVEPVRDVNLTGF